MRLLVLLAALVGVSTAMYCGRHNCYEVLDVAPTATQKEIRNAYRQLSLLHHPDKSSDPASKDKFQLIANAYEVLSDKEDRANYDHMLAHPEEFVGNMYRYYRYRAMPKVNVAPVVVIVVLTISVIQYVSHWAQNKRVVQNALLHPAIRNEAKNQAEAKDLLKGKSKEQIEAVLQQIVKENLVLKGSFAPPSIRRTLCVAILISPYTLTRFFANTVRWHYRYSWQKLEVTEEDKAMMISKVLGFSLTKYECLPEEDRAELMENECWKPENYAKFREQKEAEYKAQRAGKMKQYKRYLKREKNSGSGGLPPLPSHVKWGILIGLIGLVVLWAWSLNGPRHMYL